MTETTPRSDWDPLDPAVETDPTAEHARLRQECPVARTDRFGGFWTLTRYDDIVAAARDTGTFINSKKATIPDSAPARPPRPPLESDPPEHGAYRQVLNPYFLPRRIRQFEPVIRQLARELLDEIVDHGPVDVVPAFANPFPAGVLCAFLGLPRDDWSRIKNWANDVLGAARAGDAAAQDRANQVIYDYVADAVADRRARPRDPAADLISGLIAARIDGGRLSEDGVTGVVRLLLQAGHGTTTNGVGSAFRYLAEHPGQQRRLREQPAGIALFVEEVLRLWTPARFLARTATRDVEIGGRLIGAGEKVALMWSSGNRDETVFPGPDTFLDDRKPNRHIAFGYGIHTCLGGPLARVELRIAVEELLRRTASVQPAGPVGLARWPHIGPRSLPLRLSTSMA
jgi:cytochrome P450